MLGMVKLRTTNFRMVGPTISLRNRRGIAPLNASRYVDECVNKNQPTRKSEGITGNPMMDYIGRLHSKKVPFSGWRYLNR